MGNYRGGNEPAGPDWTPPPKKAPVLDGLMASREEIRRRYIAGESSLQIARKDGVSKWSVLRVLQSLDDWDEIKRGAHPRRNPKKTTEEITEECAGCGDTFTYTYKGGLKRNYCTKSCYKISWQRTNRRPRTEEQKRARRYSRPAPAKSDRKQWLERFEVAAARVHKIALSRFAEKMDKRVKGWKNGCRARAKKYGTDYTIELEELRLIMYEAYGTPCRYCGRTLDIHNVVLDHIVPVAKDGGATKENLQAICSKCNSMKGSLDEGSFFLLLDWLKSVPEELAHDISTRLARGIN